MLLQHTVSKPAAPRVLGWALLLACAGAPAWGDEVPRWTIDTSASTSSLSGDRADWSEYGLDLSYRAGQRTSVGASVTQRRRFGASDTLYAVQATQGLPGGVEVHGEAGTTPSPQFSPREWYSAGLAWNVTPPVALLFDYKRMNYTFGSLDMYTPGVTWDFAERDAVTFRYTFGRAFGNADFLNYSVLFKLGLPWQPGTLRFGYAHGSDPEAAPPATLLTTANTYFGYLSWQLAAHTQLYGGFEHEIRAGYYTRNTLTAGISTSF